MESFCLECIQIHIYIYYYTYVNTLASDHKNLFALSTFNLNIKRSIKRNHNMSPVNNTFNSILLYGVGLKKKCLPSDCRCTYRW